MSDPKRRIYRSYNNDSNAIYGVIGISIKKKLKGQNQNA